MTDLSWELLSERPAYEGYLAVTRRSYRMPDDRSVEWDVTPRARSVAVLAQTAEEFFILARQFRPGPGAVLDELPGGGIEDGETVGEAAGRELLEETGYRAGSLHVVGRAWQSSTSGMEQFVAVATDCVATGDSSPDPAEFIETRLVSLSQLLSVVRRGDMTDVGLAYRALDDLGLLNR